MSDEVDRRTQSESTSDVNTVNTVSEPLLYPPINELSLTESTSPMLTLHIDCFEELFEWLSLRDLLALRRTCRRLQRVVDYFIRTHYPAVKIGYGKIEIRRWSDFEVFQRYGPIGVKKIREVLLNSLNLIKEKDITNFKIILPQIEKIWILGDTQWGFLMGSLFEGDFYELVLKFCSNLKYLRISFTPLSLISRNNQWLHRHIPSLEQLHLDYNENVIENDLKIFFELNPNIKTFTTGFKFFVDNLDCFLGSHIKIDKLILSGISNDEDMYQLCGVLKILYEQGFYKRIHMIHTKGNIYQGATDCIFHVRGMERLLLPIKVFAIASTIPPIPELRELIVFYYYNDRIGFPLTNALQNFVNLERITITTSYFIVIKPFLQFARMLKEIKVAYHPPQRRGQRGRFIDCANDIIDVAMLNRERSKLAHATKVTIYVPEKVFLVTKFAKTNIDLSLVRLERAEAVEWNINS